jgi:hypothetical protein
VEAAIRVGVGDEPATIFIEVATLGFVLLVGPPVIVVVDEVMARVVGRVDVDELHLAGIGLLEELKRIEVVALDVEVPRRIPVDRPFPLGTHRLPYRLSGLRLGGRLARPRELVSLPLSLGTVTQKLV